jgi:hypothetical protein
MREFGWLTTKQTEQYKVSHHQLSIARLRIPARPQRPLKNDKYSLGTISSETCAEGRSLLCVKKARPSPLAPARQ